MFKQTAYLLCFLTFPLLLTAQKAVTNRSVLSIEQIMQGENFVGYLPENISWSEDGREIYFTWNPEMDTLRSLYKIGIDGGAPQKVEVDEQKMMPGRGEYSRDRTKKVYGKDGDIFLLDLASGQKTQITNTVERETNPSFALRDSLIVYSRDNNLYVWDPAAGSTSQLTDFKKGQKEPEPSKKDWEQWLVDDQLAMFEVLKERKDRRELQKKRNEALEAKRPLEIYFGDKRLSNVQACPDLKFVTFRLAKSSRGKGTKVPDFVTESGYIEDLNSRAKVGTPQDTYEMGVYDVERDTFFMIGTKQIEGIYDKPAFLAEYHRDTVPYKDRYDQPREVAIHGPVWSEDGKAAVVARSLDNKDRWIMLLDPPTGSLTLLDRQRDEAWIGGPGVGGWTFSGGNIGWIDDRTLWFQSEATGFSHLYKMDVESGEKTALTSGRFEILDASLSHDRRFFYLNSNKESPHEQHFYRMPAGGGAMEKLTGPAGNHDVSLSPDEKHLAVRYSYSNQPWELYVQENRSGAEMKQLTRSTTQAFRKYSWRDPQLVNFQARDGVSVPARLYRPAKPAKGGPAVIFVHGAGYLQNVHRWWSSYYREYMFHNLLADNGYTVLDIDFRASAGYGRDWRTAIYRHMGGKDLDDQVDGAKYLVEKHGVDPKRIGIYGGSYGGFITLMALFNSPGTFRAGAALRSVTDWAHYNHGYTANILNTPVEDSIAYRRSSPIYFAEGLQDQLLILHGMVDVNVQFQDVVRLAQRLIELGKENWEFAVFPVEDHGFVTPSGWTDEYKRIFKLFQETLGK
jgi:dipeptidyl aminopeptidase/acylaminoacyl peptidase